ncbi:hypothetical protein [Gorillibacterium sp. CAU 1737]|uniref:hypothetical protein n=1 Tax=Gorillibacterium sp. CAU 1737 TaxID=3140362 RepID=UPI003260D33C
MKTFYRLFAHEFGQLRGITLLLAAIAMGGPLLLLRLELKNQGSRPVPRYEDLFDASGSAALYGSLLVLTLLSFLLVFYSAYWRGKSIYTSLTLPAPREMLYASKLLALLTSLLAVYSAELIGIRLGYAYSLDKLQAIGVEHPMNNGLFLAFLRGDFLRFLLPHDPTRLLSNAAILLAVTSGILYAVLCERSRKGWGALPLTVGAITILRVLAYRLSESDRVWELSGRSLLGSSLFLLALTIWFIWRGIRFYQRGAIA